MLFTVAGCLMALNGIAANTMLQVQAPDRLRGRVMGFYSFVVLGLAPLGSLQAGWMAEHFGVRTALAAGGLVCLVVAGTVAWGMWRTRRSGAGRSGASGGGGRDPAGDGLARWPAPCRALTPSRAWAPTRAGGSGPAPFHTHPPRRILAPC